MTDAIDSRQCVVLPCTDQDLWAVPENSLAEIVTLSPACDTPPAELEWRGQPIPVLDLQVGCSDWGSRHGGTGLIAVLHGLDSSGPAFWGVCLREHGLRVEHLPETVDDAADESADYALGAFRHGGQVYQVPDLVALQRQAAER